LKDYFVLTLYTVIFLPHVLQCFCKATNKANLHINFNFCEEIMIHFQISWSRS